MLRRTAFTLLELILVLAVLGMLSALAAARLGNLRGSQALERATRLVEQQALRAQHLAASQGETVRLRIDRDDRTARVDVMSAADSTDASDGQPASVTLMDGIDTLTITFVRSDAGLVSDGPIDLLFLPDHRCDAPGVIGLASAGRAQSVTISAGARPPMVESVP
jgi:prepilin-type N-terminal cleavage/methylation domain-containing protein